jgi:hypothetical protein
LPALLFISLLQPSLSPLRRFSYNNSKKPSSTSSTSSTTSGRLPIQRTPRSPGSRTAGTQRQLRRHPPPSLTGTVAVPNRNLIHRLAFNDPISSFFPLMSCLPNDLRIRRAIYLLASPLANLLLHLLFLSFLPPRPLASISSPLSSPPSTGSCFHPHLLLLRLI